MTADGTALPSVSSLLQWARVARDAEPNSQAETPIAVPSKRFFSELGAAGVSLPTPLTSDIISRASKELPQGACLALDSCLAALKVRPGVGHVLFGLLHATGYAQTKMPSEFLILDMLTIRSRFAFARRHVLLVQICTPDLLYPAAGSRRGYQRRSSWRSHDL